MTRRLHVVTGVKSVYVVRTAENALAVYGTVRDRTEYDTIRRYARILHSFRKVPRELNTNNLPIQAVGVYTFPCGVQFFVRELDGSDAVVTRVTAETMWTRSRAPRYVTWACRSAPCACCRRRVTRQAPPRSPSTPDGTI
jgi:hypothetical protein